jgi:hypothetical protein
MRTLIIGGIAFVLVAALFASNAFVSSLTQVSAIPFPPIGTAVSSGGQGACTHTSATYCAWTNDVTGVDEIYGCSGGFTTGSFQCTAAATCLTCGHNSTLFPGYSMGASIKKGQPFFEPQLSKQLALWVQYSTAHAVLLTEWNQLVRRAIHPGFRGAQSNAEVRRISELVLAEQEHLTGLDVVPVAPGKRGWY